ncbi:MAG: single-stranded-DNA-specific exonuclease RecJ, partial [Lachnospiraceae bacterium]|nr:single-stranded-DNA-specific exonuclease RecJ [Lachnospiraceae bacterium]
MKKELWYEKKIPGDYRELSERYKVSPVMARLLVNRITDGQSRTIPEPEQVREYLSPDITRICSYKKLPDIEKCTDILSRMTAGGKRIRVIGDYDIDGVCSTYILTRGLIKAGARADHAIPHRITDGYGLNERLIREAYQAGTDCIITCDNGISAAGQIKLARELGMTVIVTDHHEVPYHMDGEIRVEELPEAEAVVDIKRHDSLYGFTEICGAQIAFKVIAALYEKLGLPISETEEFIEFAAFAAIGDIMPLINENRALVSEGLKRLTATSNPGMRALIKAQGIKDTSLRPYHVGFVLGPCVNATGRLATADNAFELLVSETPREAEKLADMLVAMNNDRKEMTEKGTKRALEQAEESDMVNDRVMVIYLPDMHESVAGIIAGRVREQTGKPSFVLTDGENGIKGSGRSIEEYDMYAAMTEVSDLFEKYGGHKMAGGLSLKEGVKPELLRQRLNDSCTLTEHDLTEKIHFDLVLPFSYVNMELAEDIDRM